MEVEKKVGKCMKFKIDRNRKVVIFTLDDPRVRGYREEMPFEVWYKFQAEVTRRIAKSHHA